MDKTFTYQELLKHNGKNGARAYICFRGVIYDVTDSDLWKSGRHQNLHDAGDDLTTTFERAPHGTDVFERVKEVGKLA